MEPKKSYEQFLYERSLKQQGLEPEDSPGTNRAQKTATLTAKELLEIDYPPQQWVIDRFLPDGGITLIVGEAGTLKSFICLYLTRQVITQEKLFGHFEVYKTCRVLIIDKENKLRRIQKRLKGLNFPDTEDVFFLAYPDSFSFENKEFMNYLKKFIAEEKIDLVILDSFVDMFTGNENSSGDTAQAINAMRSLSPTATFALIHHDSKPVPKLVRTAAQKTRGSSNIIAQVDAQFYFEKGKDLKSLTIEQGKSRDEEPLPKFEVRIESDPELGITGFTYNGEIRDEVTMINQSKEVIYQFVKTHPSCTKDEINTELEVNNITTRTGKNGLMSLMKEGLIDYSEKPGHGRKHFYFVVEANDDPENE